MLGASSEVNHEAGDDEDGDQEDCAGRAGVNTGALVASSDGTGAGGDDSLLMIENTNSDSPNHLTPKMLIRHVPTQIAAM